MQTDFSRFFYSPRHPVQKSKFGACAVTGYCSFNSWLIPKSNRIDYKIIVLLIYLVVYLKPFRLSESCFYTSGKNHVPLILKRKCNYFWQINHSNSVCLSNLSALIAKFSASFMYFNYIRTFPDI